MLHTVTSAATIAARKLITRANRGRDKSADEGRKNDLVRLMYHLYLNFLGNPAGVYDTCENAH